MTTYNKALADRLLAHADGWPTVYGTDRANIAILREAAAALTPPQADKARGEVLQRHVVTKYRDGSVHVADLDATPQPQGDASPEDVLRCMNGCGRAYSDFNLDVMLPDDQWTRVSGREDGSGVMCAACIVERASKLDGVTVMLAAFDQRGLAQHATWNGECQVCSTPQVLGGGEVERPIWWKGIELPPAGWRPCSRCAGQGRSDDCSTCGGSGWRKKCGALDCIEYGCCGYSKCYVSKEQVAAALSTPQARPDGGEGFEVWLDRDWPLWRNNTGHPILGRLRRCWEASHPAPAPDMALARTGTGDAWDDWSRTLRRLIGDRTDKLHFAADVQANADGVRFDNCRFVHSSPEVSNEQ